MYDNIKEEMPHSALGIPAREWENEGHRMLRSREEEICDFHMGNARAPETLSSGFYKLTISIEATELVGWLQCGSG